MATQYDVIIVGGGMVGLTMAAALAKTNLQIAVLETGSFRHLSTGNWLDIQACEPSDYQNRVSAISPGNQAYLSKLGIWQSIPESRKANYQRMKVWDGDGDGKIAFDAADLAVPFLGTIVENQVIRAAALASLQAFTNVETIENSQVAAISESNQIVTINLDSGEQLACQLLIGADGALSAVRQQLGINSQAQSYDQTAFVANVKTEFAHQDTAWQRFTQSGPVAFLPLPDPNLCSIVWSIDSDQAEALKPLSESAFVSRLSHAIENRFGKLSPISKVASFPLIKRHSERYLTQQCVLIGDAAHTIHPLAGQGVNLGFQDVECLSRLMQSLIENNRSWTLMANLRPFERERKAENALMQNAMTGFKWLFGHTAMVPTLLRNSALNFVDNAAPIKHEIIRRAMGI
ncbi:FAD-binding protein [Aliikangiella marina]|uniref:FAD-binding protein n=1 Tax=Aliikangiella marina TaxID=1712262 RepID=A0A545T1C3_9GAMM|nr:UbiH/UbiF/VisC/COQ6 family ubiquinone biosynthesis hydroxylase [Aliikangiella marina]TQV71011.1 FAD-binding protein [Aliikangiella marina]